MRHLLLLSLFLASCNQYYHTDYMQGHHVFNNVDPKIQVYFDKFTAKTGVSMTGITAGFLDLPSGIGGECVFSGQYREIRIDPTYWKQIEWNDTLLEQLIEHESGHCALYLEHISDVAPNGQPLSIMNPTAFSQFQSIYLKYRMSDYIKALLSNKPISYP